MSRTILLAMGLSAIDGLLCAFVAIFALAFIMPAAEVAGAPRDADSVTQLILLEKSQGHGGAARLGLQLTLIAGANKYLGIATPADGLVQVGWDAVIPVGVSGQFRDCMVQEGLCTSRLILAGLPPRSRVEIRPFLADSAAGLTDEPPASVLLKARFATPNQFPVAQPILLTYATEPADGPVLIMKVEQAGTTRWSSH